MTDFLSTEFEFQKMKAQAQPRLQREKEAEKDWEDEYRKLRAQHNELRVLCNQQEDHIKK